MTTVECNVAKAKDTETIGRIPAILMMMMMMMMWVRPAEHACTGCCEDSYMLNTLAGKGYADAPGLSVLVSIVRPNSVVALLHAALHTGNGNSINR